LSNKNIVERDLLIYRLCSPFIVKGHFQFETADKYYVIMDYMCGGRLYYHVKKAEGARFSE